MHHMAIYHFVLGYGTASYWELVGTMLCDCDSFLVFAVFELNKMKKQNGNYVLNQVVYSMWF